MADNLVEIFQVMTKEEVDAVVLAYNHMHVGANLHPGIVPFLNRKQVLQIISDFISICDDSEDDYITEYGDDDDRYQEAAAVLEVFEVMLKRVRITPLTKAQAKELREDILDRIERGLV